MEFVYSWCVSLSVCYFRGIYETLKSPFHTMPYHLSHTLNATKLANVIKTPLTLL